MARRPRASFACPHCHHAIAAATVARWWQRQLGAKTSTRKAAAARANGARGGRPRVIWRGETFDGALTTEGFRVEIRHNRTARIESYSPWAGATTGAVWIAPVPTALDAMVYREPDDAIRVRVIEWLHHTDWTATATRTHEATVVPPAQEPTHE